MAQQSNDKATVLNSVTTQIVGTLSLLGALSAFEFGTSRSPGKANRQEVSNNLTEGAENSSSVEKLLDDTYQKLMEQQIYGEEVLAYQDSVSAKCLILEERANKRNEEIEKLRTQLLEARGGLSTSGRNNDEAIKELELLTGNVLEGYLNGFQSLIELNSQRISELPTWTTKRVLDQFNAAQKECDETLVTALQWVGELNELLSDTKTHSGAKNLVEDAMKDLLTQCHDIRQERFELYQEKFVSLMGNRGVDEETAQFYFQKAILKGAHDATDLSQLDRKSFQSLADLIESGEFVSIDKNHPKAGIVLTSYKELAIIMTGIAAFNELVEFGENIVKMKETLGNWQNNADCEQILLHCEKEAVKRLDEICKGLNESSGLYNEVMRQVVSEIAMGASKTCIDHYKSCNLGKIKRQGIYDSKPDLEDTLRTEGWLDKYISGGSSSSDTDRNDRKCTPSSSSGSSGPSSGSGSGSSGGGSRGSRGSDVKK